MQKSDDKNKKPEESKSDQSNTPSYKKPEEPKTIVGLKKWMETRQEWLKVHFTL